MDGKAFLCGFYSNGNASNKDQGWGLKLTTVLHAWEFATRFVTVSSHGLTARTVGVWWTCRCRQQGSRSFAPSRNRRSSPGQQNQDYTSCTLDFGTEKRGARSGVSNASTLTA